MIIIALLKKLNLQFVHSLFTCGYKNNEAPAKWNFQDLEFSPDPLVLFKQCFKYVWPLVVSGGKSHWTPVVYVVM